jgi:hypothetical protein
MPTFPLHYRLSYGGSFRSDGDEIWSNNINFASDQQSPGSDEPITGAQQQAIADALWTKIGAFMGTVGSAYSTNVTLEYAKFNAIGADGLYVDKQTTHGHYLTGTPGGGSGASEHPISAALVVSWLTSLSRGPGSHGRVYVPNPAVTLDAETKRIPAGRCLQVANAWKAALIDWNGTVNQLGGDTLRFASVVSGVGEGSAQEVNRVKVGDVLDHMQSRRNRLREAYSTTTAFGA